MNIIKGYMLFSGFCSVLTLGLIQIFRPRLLENGWYAVMDERGIKRLFCVMLRKSKLIVAHFVPFMGIAIPCVIFYMLSHKRPHK